MQRVETIQIVKRKQKLEQRIKRSIAMKELSRV